MTQFSDDLYLGAVRSTPKVSNPANGGQGFGPMGRIFFYNIVPLTLSVAAYAASQTPSGAGNLTLSVGTGVTQITDPGGHVAYKPDVPRAVSVASAGNDTGVTFTVSGYDFLGQLQTEAITGASGATATGKKAFASLWQIAASGATASTITAGTSNVFGLPMAVADAGYIVHPGWAGALADDAGTFVAADATTPATSTTGDVRGTYLPSSAANGARRLVLAIHTTAIQVGPNATFAGLYGVTPA